MQAAEAWETGRSMRSVDLRTDGVFVGATPSEVSGVAMWKSMFLAVGIFATLVGIELLFIDSAVISPLTGGSSQTVAAPEWAPWLLISVGAITILNLCTLPRGLIKE
ncbi:MAG: hypothetical protein EBZ13_00355 [Planctomycetia bacterium]|nr:hypothetical protein [Planctomycetia bacterium]